MKIADAQLLWSAEPGWLNTATYGLPPTPAWDAVQSVLADWRSGLTSWEKWGESTERSRESFARLVGVRTDQVAVGATVSGLIGLVAAGGTARGRGGSRRGRLHVTALPVASPRRSRYRRAVSSRIRARRRGRPLNQGGRFQPGAVRDRTDRRSRRHRGGRPEPRGARHR